MKAHATPRHLLAWLPLAEEAVAGGGEAGGDLLGLGQHVGHAGLLALHGDSPVYPAPGMRGGVVGGVLVVLQKVSSEANPKVRNHGEGPY